MKKHYTNILVVLFAFGLMLAGGCDNTPTETENYQPEPLLSAYIYNGEAVEEVWLEHVAPLYGFYTPENNGIPNSEITIFEVGGDDTLHFQPDPAQPTSGRYVPADGDELIPRSLRRYRIEVTTPQGEFLWSESVMPDKMVNVGVVLVDEDGNVTQVADGDTLNRSMPNMYWGWETVDSSGGYQGIITTLVDIDSLEGLNPEWKPEDLPEMPVERIRSKWMTMRYDQQQIILPWLFFEWVGPHRIELYAISTEYYDYLRSVQMLNSGMINHPQYNVTGGLGVFGTISKYSMNIYMERVEL